MCQIMSRVITLDEWVGLETTLLAHVKSIITTVSLPLHFTGISIEGLKDYVDNDPNTD